MKSLKQINESVNEGKVYVTATDAEENVFLVKEYPNEDAANKEVYDDGTGEYSDLSDKYQDVMDNGYYIGIAKKKPSKHIKDDNPKAVLKESEELNEATSPNAKKAIKELEDLKKAFQNVTVSW